MHALFLLETGLLLPSGQNWKNKEPMVSSRWNLPYAIFYQNSKAGDKISCYIVSLLSHCNFCSFGHNDPKSDECLQKVSITVFCLFIALFDFNINIGSTSTTNGLFFGSTISKHPVYSARQKNPAHKHRQLIFDTCKIRINQLQVLSNCLWYNQDVE